MANMCYNYVTCTGSTTDIDKLELTLREGIKHSELHHEASDLGVDIQEAYFFSIEIGDKLPTALQFSYETKWSTNLLDLAELCKRLNLSAVCEYNECGVELYGSAHISPDGTIINDEVPADFLNLIELDEETDLYIYNGIEYNTQGDIINEHYADWKKSQLKTEE